jgi:pyridoxal phosphate enzyme (YggS family)
MEFIRKCNIDSISYNINRIVNDIFLLNSYRDVEIIAVTKNFSCVCISEVIKCGINNIAENRIKESLIKFKQLGHLIKNVRKHFIGRLQSNKIKKIVKNFDLIQSVDNIKHVKYIDDYAKQINKIQKCLIEVKIFDEIKRSGVIFDDVEEFCEQCKLMKNIEINGLMFIAPYSCDYGKSRKLFKKIYILFEKLKHDFFQCDNFNILSMGMSNDYKIAIEEGSTMIRIGSAIFEEKKILT